MIDPGLNHDPHVDPLLGASAVATRLGVSRQALHLWRREGVFPEPSLVVEGRCLWYRSVVDGWSGEWLVVGVRGGRAEVRRRPASGGTGRV